MVKSRSRIMPFNEHLKLAEQLQASLLMTPRGQFVTIKPEDLISSATTLMKENRFDQLPVEDKTQIIGLVRHEKIKNLSQTANVTKYIETAIPYVKPTDCVNRVLISLQNETCIFVSNHKGVIGLIHRSDLNKQVVRTYFYLWLAAIEMDIASKLETQYGLSQGWLELLDPKRQEKIKKDYKRLTHGNMDIDLIELTCLSDLFQLIQKNKTILENFGIKSDLECEEVNYPPASWGAS